VNIRPVVAKNITEQGAGLNERTTRYDASSARINPMTAALQQVTKALKDQGTGNSLGVRVLPHVQGRGNEKSNRARAVPPKDASPLFLLFDSKLVGFHKNCNRATPIFAVMCARSHLTMLIGLSAVFYATERAQMAEMLRR